MKTFHTTLSVLIGFVLTLFGKFKFTDNLNVDGSWKLRPDNGHFTLLRKRPERGSFATRTSQFKLRCADFHAKLDTLRENFTLTPGRQYGGAAG